MNESFWVPVGIIEEKVIRIQGQHSRPRYPVVSEIWTLERIIAVREVELGPVEEVNKNKVKSENSDNRHGVVNLIEKSKETSTLKGKEINRTKSRTKTGEQGNVKTRIGK